MRQNIVVLYYQSDVDITSASPSRLAYFQSIMNEISYTQHNFIPFPNYLKVWMELELETSSRLPLQHQRLTKHELVSQGAKLQIHYHGLIYVSITVSYYF